VKPCFPAQVPSVEAFLAGAGAAEVAAGLTVAPPEHVPKAELQEAPQWSAVLPHHPYWLQQFPKVEPEQVKPVVPPHVPSVETFLVPVAVGAEGAVVLGALKHGVRRE
jgi:hypothetical protein